MRVRGVRAQHKKVACTSLYASACNFRVLALNVSVLESFCGDGNKTVQRDKRIGAGGPLMTNSFPSFLIISLNRSNLRSGILVCVGVLVLLSAYTCLCGLCV